MLKGRLCPLPDMRHLHQIVPGVEQITEEPLVTCCRFCSTHHQPQLRAYTCSLGAACGSSMYYGALLWTSTLTATLRFSSSLWLSSHQGCIDLRKYFPSSAFLNYQEVPFLVGSFSLKGIKSPKANLQHATLLKHSSPEPSCHDNVSPFLYIPALMYL